MHCSVIEHGMTSVSFQTAVQKNEAKLSSFLQFGNEMPPLYLRTSLSNKKKRNLNKGHWLLSRWLSCVGESLNMSH